MERTVLPGGQLIGEREYLRKTAGVEEQHRVVRPEAAGADLADEALIRLKPTRGASTRFGRGFN